MYNKEQGGLSRLVWSISACFVRTGFLKCLSFLHSWTITWSSTRSNYPDSFLWWECLCWLHGVAVGAAGLQKEDPGYWKRFITINGSLVFISIFCDCSILSVKHFSVFLCFGVWIILQLEMLLLAAHLHLFVAPVELKDKKLHATGSTFQFGITLLNIWTVCVTAVTS